MKICRDNILEPSNLATQIVELGFLFLYMALSGDFLGFRLLLCLPYLMYVAGTDTADSGFSFTYSSERNRDGEL